MTSTTTRWVRRQGSPARPSVRQRTRRLPRGLHPGAWWLWALSLAVAASRTTNPLLLAILLAVTSVVVVARRSDAPWARAYRLYLVLGAVIIVLRVLLHVAVGFKYGDHVLLRLPEVPLPDWAAGIQLGGTVYLEGLLGAIFEGLRLATLIACIGAANALANPKRLLRALPGALHEIGVAFVVSLTVAPQLADSVHRVRRARRLRGDTVRGIRAVGRIAMPVLQDALDRSILLAAAMDSRGYGRSVHPSPRTRRMSGALVLTGLMATCIGTFGLLDAQSATVLGVPALLAGLVLAAAGTWLGGQQVRRSIYRPDPWRAPEWATAACGLAAVAAMLFVGHTDPNALTAPLQPLAVPALPLVATAGILVAGLAAIVSPVPQNTARQVPMSKSPPVTEPVDEGLHP
ncbi:MAG TPA: energy-coupling factor transporter transmembrane component T [Dermatophilaceae bacterium]|jgi:energy-coupling factor transport system permease protein